MIVSLATLDTAAAAVRPSPTPRAPGQLREGLRYVRSTPALAIPLCMMALIGTLAYEFQVVLPVVARGTFHGGPEAYGFMTAAMGVGAVVGGLSWPARAAPACARSSSRRRRSALAILLAAAAPDLPLELVALTLVGGCSVTFIAIGNTTLQLIDPARHARARDEPVGRRVPRHHAARRADRRASSRERAGGRAGLLLGGVACLVAAGAGVLALRRTPLLAPAGG